MRAFVICFGIYLLCIGNYLLCIGNSLGWWLLFIGLLLMEGD